jgi:hypothetical protein
VSLNVARAQVTILSSTFDVARTGETKMGDRHRLPPEARFA